MKKIIVTMACLSLGILCGAQDLTILHTNDTHSHIDPVRAGEEAGMGGVIERAVFVAVSAMPWARTGSCL